MANNDITPSKKQKGIDFVSLFMDCKSKWYYFIISVVCCMAFAVLYNYVRKPLFQVKTSVVISQEDQSATGSMMKGTGMADLFGKGASVDNELLIITSHAVLKETVKELQVHKSYKHRKNFLKREYKYKDSPIEISCDESIVDTLMAELKFKVKVDEDENISMKVYADRVKLFSLEDLRFPACVETAYGTFMFNKTSFFEDGEDLRMDITITGYHPAAESLQTLVMSYLPDKKADVIEISMNNSNPTYAKDILSTIVKNYNQRTIDEVISKNLKTVEFIDQRLDGLTSELSDAEREIEKFKIDKKITNVGAEASYLYNRTNVLENNLVAAETEFEILSMTREFLSNPENKYSLIPNVSGSGSAGAAIGGYNSLALERLKLMNNAKANNKALKALEDQMDTLQASIVETLNKSYETSLFRLNELKSQTNKSQAKLSGVPTQERQYRDLQRQQEIKQEIYLFLLQRREEAALNSANAMPRGILIDEAYRLNEALSWSTKKLFLIFLFLGFCLPIGYFYLCRMLRTKFSTKEDVEQMTNIPILGEMCTTSSDETLVVKAGGSSSAAELFRLIRSNLQFILGGMNDKVVLLTSTVSGEGKSFISINLAASLAMLGKKVVLVGMDIRCPKLAEYLNLKVNKGLTEYLSAQSITLDDIVIKDAMQENLDIIVAGPIPPNPSELLASSKVDHLFTALREKYDYIIVDSAPVGMVSDTFSLARISDATVYVCRANYTKLKDIEYINSLYADNRLKRMSLVVNGTESKKGYGYGYGGGQK